MWGSVSSHTLKICALCCIYVIFLHYLQSKNQLLDNDSIVIYHDAEETKQTKTQTSRLQTPCSLISLWQLSTNMGQTLLQYAPWIHHLCLEKQESSLNGSSSGQVTFDLWAHYHNCCHSPGTCLQGSFTSSGSKTYTPMKSRVHGSSAWCIWKPLYPKGTFHQSEMVF